MKDNQKITIDAIVLAVGKPYDFIPEGQTENVYGCKLAYIPTSDINVPYYDEETEIIGHYPQEVRMEPEFYQQVKDSVQLPCKAKITFDILFKTSGVRTSLSNIEFVKAEKSAK